MGEKIVGVVYGFLELFHLAADALLLGAAGLILTQSVAHLGSGLIERLLEVDEGSLLLCLGNLELCGELPVGKERLNERTNGRSQELGRIGDGRTGAVGPTSLTADGQ